MSGGTDRTSSWCPESWSIGWCGKSIQLGVKSVVSSRRNSVFLSFQLVCVVAAEKKRVSFYPHYHVTSMGVGSLNCLAHHSVPLGHHLTHSVHPKSTHQMNKAMKNDICAPGRAPWTPVFGDVPEEKPLRKDIRETFRALDSLRPQWGPLDHTLPGLFCPGDPGFTMCNPRELKKLKESASANVQHFC